jgi:Glycosyl transferase family 2
VSTAPILLFTYKRLWHTQECVKALQKNMMACDSELIVFSDGPRKSEDNAAVDSLRKYFKTIHGFKKVSVVERRENLGLAKSIISGVSEAVTKYGRVIVLEDDLVTSPFFLKFMNDALEYYQENERVISAHGYVYPVHATLPDTFFLRGADCWGWATWKRGWDLFEPDGKKLLSEIRTRNLERDFDFDGNYPYTKMLKDQTKGKNDSWAIRWHASAYLSGKLTLYPGKSLVRNIGADNSGTHTGKTLLYDTMVSEEPVRVSNIPIEENRFARNEIERYLRRMRPGVAARLIYKVTHVLK